MAAPPPAAAAPPDADSQRPAQQRTPAQPPQTPAVLAAGSGGGESVAAQLATQPQAAAGRGSGGGGALAGLGSFWSDFSRRSALDYLPPAYKVAQDTLQRQMREAVRGLHGALARGWQTLIHARQLDALDWQLPQ